MKKSHIAILLIILISVVANQYFRSDITATSENSYAAEAETSISEAADSGDHNWGNPNTLQDHFKRHGPDFNARDAQDYARQANEFYKDRDDYQIKKHDGVTRVYDPETNTFGAYNEDGSTRTFYKPSDGQDYFDRQPGN